MNDEQIDGDRIYRFEQQAQFVVDIQSYKREARGGSKLWREKHESLRDAILLLSVLLAG